MRHFDLHSFILQSLNLLRSRLVAKTQKSSVELWSNRRAGRTLTSADSRGLRIDCLEPVKRIPEFHHFAITLPELCDTIGSNRSKSRCADAIKRLNRYQ